MSKLAIVKDVQDNSPKPIASSPDRTFSLAVKEAELISPEKSRQAKEEHFSSLKKMRNNLKGTLDIQLNPTTPKDDPERPPLIFKLKKFELEETKEEQS